MLSATAESSAARRAANSSSAARRATESPAAAMARAALSDEATFVQTWFTPRATRSERSTSTGPMDAGRTDGMSR